MSVTMGLMKTAMSRVSRSVHDMGYRCLKLYPSGGGGVITPDVWSAASTRWRRSAKRWGPSSTLPSIAGPDSISGVPDASSTTMPKLWAPSRAR